MLSFQERNILNNLHMSNIALLYSSKYGTTATICQSIGKQLEAKASVTLVDIDRKNDICLSDYDTVVLGTSIYAGKPRKQMSQWCAQNQATVRGKRLFLFVCGMDKPHAVTELEAAYPPSLREQAIATTFFEGEYRLETMRFFDRMILQLLVKVKTPLHRTYDELVKDFAGKIVS